MGLISFQPGYLYSTIIGISLRKLRYFLGFPAGEEQAPPSVLFTLSNRPVWQEEDPVGVRRSGLQFPLGLQKAHSLWASVYASVKWEQAASRCPVVEDGWGHIHREGADAGDRTHSRQRQGSWTQRPGGQEGKRLERQQQEVEAGGALHVRWGPLLSSTLALTSDVSPPRGI